jgi:hypothetical protein
MTEEIDKAVLWYEGGCTYHPDEMKEGKLYKGYAFGVLMGIMKKDGMIHTFQWYPDPKDENNE